MRSLEKLFGTSCLESKQFFSVLQATGVYDISHGLSANQTQPDIKLDSQKNDVINANQSGFVTVM